MNAKAPKIGPHSGPTALAKLDQRTREAALMRCVRAELLAHVGHTPSAVQRALIERIVMLSLHVALFDARAIEAGALSERDSRSYLAYSNSLERALRQLGVKGAPAPRRSVADILADERAGAAGTH